MKRQFGLAALAIISLTCLAAAPQPTQLMRDPIDGKWVLTVTPDDDARTAGEKEFKDNIEFKGGKFTSESMQKHGFDPGPYDEDPTRGGMGTFDAALKSKTDEGKAKWHGLVTANEMTGDFVWTKKDGTVCNFTFKGTRPT
jgi:hypothetical protein